MDRTEVRTYVLAKNQLDDAIGKLFELGADVIAPTKATKGDIFFRKVEKPGDIVLDFPNSSVSPVEHLRPPKEIYFEYETSEGQPPKIEPSPPPKPFIIFGIRPCDVSAVMALDYFFIKREPVDNLYMRRRQAVTLVALACAVPAAETCFCPCCEGGGPVADEGYDVQLTPLGDIFVVEVASEKGQRIYEAWKELLTPATTEIIEDRERQKNEALKMFELQSNLAAAVRRVSAHKVTRETWGEIAENCYSCGACSFVCPVCTCFDVNDLQFDAEHGARVRQMDSCRLFGYPREAAGGVRGFETPYRARMYSYHKLGYDHYKERGRYGCVGCGRCIQSCLGHMGMPSVCKLARQAPHTDQATTNDTAAKA